MEYFAPMATPIIVIRIPILLIKFSPINFSISDFFFAESLGVCEGVIACFFSVVKVSVSCLLGKTGSVFRKILSAPMFCPTSLGKSALASLFPKFPLKKDLVF